ncbi:MAG TPA: hypothetical protein VHZ03_33900 [Trebonia sp.]|nr:hypothetical protein [Trebonia sp.]
MTYLIWRQYRLQWAIALALLAAFAAIELVTGLHMAAAWHNLVTTCGAAAVQHTQHGGGGACGQGSIISKLGNDMRVLSVLVPALIGFLWGAPLVAHEIETGTRTFAWAQGITRNRWLAVKVGWMLLAAALWGGAVSGMVTWWSGPANALNANQFQANYFDTQGIAPIGYAVFAAALGIAAGTVLRRTLPAIAVTIGGFIGLRLWIDSSFRSHYMTPVTTYVSLTSDASPGGPTALQIGGDMVGPNGQVLAQNYNDGAVLNGVPISSFPKACQSAANSPTGNPIQCLAAHGYRAYVTYQPGNRFWAFQGIETGIFVALAAAAIALTFVVINRRDA